MFEVIVKCIYIYMCTPVTMCRPFNSILEANRYNMLTPDTHGMAPDLVNNAFKSKLLAETKRFEPSELKPQKNYLNVFAITIIEACFHLQVI